MCDKQIYKYQNWSGLQHFFPGLQILKPLVSLSSLPPSMTLRITFRAGVVFKRQEVASLTKTITWVEKENTVCQHIRVPGRGSHQVSGHSMYQLGLHL